MLYCQYLLHTVMREISADHIIAYLLFCTVSTSQSLMAYYRDKWLWLWIGSVSSHPNSRQINIL